MASVSKNDPTYQPPASSVPTVHYTSDRYGNPVYAGTTPGTSGTVESHPAAADVAQAAIKGQTGTPIDQAAGLQQVQMSVAQQRLQEPITRIENVNTPQGAERVYYGATGKSYGFPADALSFSGANFPGGLPSKENPYGSQKNLQYSMGFDFGKNLTEIGKKAGMDLSYDTKTGTITQYFSQPTEKQYFTGMATNKSGQSILVPGKDTGGTIKTYSELTTEEKLNLSGNQNLFPMNQFQIYNDLGLGKGKPESYEKFKPQEENFAQFNIPIIYRQGNNIIFGSKVEQPLKLSEIPRIADEALKTILLPITAAIKVTHPDFILEKAGQGLGFEFNVLEETIKPFQMATAFAINPRQAGKMYSTSEIKSAFSPKEMLSTAVNKDYTTTGINYAFAVNTAFAFIFPLETAVFQVSKPNNTLTTPEKIGYLGLGALWSGGTKIGEFAVQKTLGAEWLNIASEIAPKPTQLFKWGLQGAELGLQYGLPAGFVSSQFFNINMQPTPETKRATAQRSEEELAYMTFGAFPGGFVIGTGLKQADTLSRLYKFDFIKIEENKNYDSGLSSTNIPLSSKYSISLFNLEKTADFRSLNRLTRESIIKGEEKFPTANANAKSQLNIFDIYQIENPFGFFPEEKPSMSVDIDIGKEKFLARELPKAISDAWKSEVNEKNALGVYFEKTGNIYYIPEKIEKFGTDFFDTKYILSHELGHKLDIEKFADLKMTIKQTKGWSGDFAYIKSGGFNDILSARERNYIKQKLYLNYIDRGYEGDKSITREFRADALAISMLDKPIEHLFRTKKFASDIFFKKNGFSAPKFDFHLEGYGYHTTPGQLGKSVSFSAGSSEVPGLYISSEASIYFLKLRGEGEERLYSFADSTLSPTIVRQKVLAFDIIPKSFKQTMNLKELQELSPDFNFNLGYLRESEFILTQGEKGKAYIIGRKSEIEAVIPPGTISQRFGVPYYTKVPSIVQAQNYEFFERAGKQEAVKRVKQFMWSEPLTYVDKLLGYKAGQFKEFGIQKGQIVPIEFRDVGDILGDIGKAPVVREYAKNKQQGTTSEELYGSLSYLEASSFSVPNFESSSLRSNSKSSSLSSQISSLTYSSGRKSSSLSSGSFSSSSLTSSSSDLSSGISSGISSFISSSGSISSQTSSTISTASSSSSGRKSSGNSSQIPPPSIPSIDLDIFKQKKRITKSKTYNRKFRYTSSVQAVVFDIKGIMPKIETGINIRPVFR